MAETWANRILGALRASMVPLDDDQLAARLGASRRQTINQVCRHLQDQGILRRQAGPDGKIVNVLLSDSMPSCRPPTSPTPAGPAGSALMPTASDVKASGVASEVDLRQRGFRRCAVTARALNIDHPDPGGRGPFCRLLVEDLAPARSGVYAWVRDGEVMYVGKAGSLQQIVHGTRMGRANNDYTYVPPSKLTQISNPRVRVNGLLNQSLVAGATVTWWWLETATESDARQLEATLIVDWEPPWNRARPVITQIPAGNY
jgi:hypothetical protein